MARTPAQITSPDIADLFITMPTRVAELSKIVPPHKIIGFEILPSKAFFVDMARLPEGTNVHIFHNNQRGGETFSKNCMKYGINTHLQFAYIPFQELAEQPLREMLNKAQHIAGTNIFVAEQGILQKNTALI